MPVLNLTDETSRFIAPSTDKLPVDQQGWVEMATYPLCADDYVNIMGRGGENADGSPKDPTLNINAEVLARRIKDWNYTDPTGLKLAVTAKACARIPVGDQLFFMNRISADATPEVGDEGLKASTPTSRPEPTASPQT